MAIPNAENSKQLGKSQAKKFENFPYQPWLLLFIFAEKPAEPADFEKAIAAAGYGLYNILLYLILIPATFGSNFQTTTMWAYICIFMLFIYLFLWWKQPFISPNIQTMKNNKHKHKLNR